MIPPPAGNGQRGCLGVRAEKVGKSPWESIVGTYTYEVRNRSVNWSKICKSITMSITDLLIASTEYIHVTPTPNDNDFSSPCSRSVFSACL